MPSDPAANNALTPTDTGLRGRSRSLFLAALLAALVTPGDAGAENLRFAAAVYHFNVQYVAGGLEALVADLQLQATWQGLDYSEAGVEDAIIRESFLPLLEMYQRHPAWGADFELQGLMVDIIRQRHPDVLTLMQQLDGQVSFDSFHYSDELWTAQPAEVMARSRLETQAAFAAAGLNVGRTAFTQEGQFGSGMGSVLPAGDVAILPRNLFGLHYSDSERASLYRMGDVGVVIGGHGWTQQVGGNSVELAWTWMDDGELLATNDLDPYFLPSFVHHPESVAEYELHLQQLEITGYTIATVAEAVDALRALGYQGEPLPPLIDGAWQPRDTNNLGLWMGDTGFWPETEADNAVRTNWHRSFAQLRAADALVSAGLADPPALGLASAWRELFLAGVSDATGWNPYRSEVAYSFAHAAAASAAAQEVLGSVDVGCEGCMLRVPWDRDEVVVAGADELDGVAAEPFLDGVGVATGSELVSAEFAWFTNPVVSGATGLSVTFFGADTSSNPSRWIDIPLNTAEIRFLPAGGNDLVSVPLSVFAGAEQAVGVPLANGILGLGDDRFLVLDPRSMMLAARLHPSQSFVRFVDHSAALVPDEVWQIYFTSGEDSARALSQQLVQRPDVWFVPAPAANTACACAQSGAELGPTGWLWLLLVGVALPMARRRPDLRV